jgi:hypothetical protein
MDRTRIGESLEWAIKNRIIETMSAYAMTDEPQGFFKYMLAGIMDLLKSIQSTSILSHSSVHSSVRQILRTIYERLTSIPFVEKEGRRQMDESYLNE